MQKNQKLTRLSFSALFAAITAIFIYLIHIPYGSTGYIHIGDAVIFLCAALLPAPYAILASAVGAGLADFLSGFPLYIVPTVIIKALMTLPFSSAGKKLLTKRNALAAVAAGLINIALYAVTEFIFGLFVYQMPAAGALTTAVSTLPQNLLQSTASAVVFFALAAALDRFKLKNKYTL